MEKCVHLAAPICVINGMSKHVHYGDFDMTPLQIILAVFTILATLLAPILHSIGQNLGWW